MDRFVIDPQTGDVVDLIHDGDRIVRANSIKSYRDMQLKGKTIDITVEYVPDHQSFTKLYRDAYPMLASCKLSACEASIFMYLASNIRYVSNIAKKPNGALITRQSLIEDLNLSEPTVKRSIRAMIKEGIIVEASTMEGKVFVINPYIVNVGDKISRTIYDMFRKSKWARW